MKIGEYLNLNGLSTGLNSVKSDSFTAVNLAPVNGKHISTLLITRLKGISALVITLSS